MCTGLRAGTFVGDCKGLGRQAIAMRSHVAKICQDLGLTWHASTPRLAEALHQMVAHKKLRKLELMKEVSVHDPQATLEIAPRCRELLSRMMATISEQKRGFGFSKVFAALQELSFTCQKAPPVLEPPCHFARFCTEKL